MKRASFVPLIGCRKQSCDEWSGRRVLDVDSKELKTVIRDRSVQRLSLLYGKLNLVLVIGAPLSVCGSGSVAAQQTNESCGPGGYGWQQVFDETLGQCPRITGSANRRRYDWEFKKINPPGREEGS